MGRTLSTNNQSETVKTVTRPVYLLKIAFTTPLCLSSREEITYNGDTYLSENLVVSLRRPQASVQIFNSKFAYGPFFGNGGSGVPVQIYKVYGEQPFGVNDPDLFWDGETGPATIDEWIRFSLRPHRSIASPRIVANSSIFPRLPPDGTEIKTPAGITVLKRRD